MIYWICLLDIKSDKKCSDKSFFSKRYKLLFLNYSFVVCLHFIDAVRGNSKTGSASEADVSAAIKGWLKNVKKRSSSQQSVDSDGDDTPHESDKQNQVAKNAKKRLLSQQSVDSDGDDTPHESDKQNQVATRIESDQIGLLMRSCQRMSDLEWKKYFLMMMIDRSDFKCNASTWGNFLKLRILWLFSINRFQDNWVEDLNWKSLEIFIL